MLTDTKLKELAESCDIRPDIRGRYVIELSHLRKFANQLYRPPNKRLSDDDISRIAQYIVSTLYKQNVEITIGALSLFKMIVHTIRRDRTQQGRL